MKSAFGISAGRYSHTCWIGHTEELPSVTLNSEVALGQFMTPSLMDVTGDRTVHSVELIHSIVKSIQETKQVVKEVPVSKSNFLMLAFYLGELQLLVEDLNKEDQQLINSFPVWAALNRLEKLSNQVHRFAKECASRSRIFLLYRVGSLLKDIRKLVKDLANGLSDMPNTLPVTLKEGFDDVREKLTRAGFYMEPGHQKIAEEIQTGLSSRHVDEPFATNLLRSIAEVLSVPLSAAAELKLELQRDLETTDLVQNTADMQALVDLCELLSPAAVLADVRRLAVEDCGLARFGSFQMNSAFICPITGQLMRDPVMLVDAGFTYEKEAICEWFDRGHRTCPDTGEELESLELVPNYALREAIHEFIERATRSSLTNAIDKIRESQVDTEVEEAVDTIKSLGDTNPNYKRLIASMDGIPPLVGIVKHQKNRMPRVWEKVVKLLWSIACLGDNYRIMIKDAGIIPALIRNLWKADVENAICLHLLYEIVKVEEGKRAILELEKSLIIIAHAANGSSEELRSVAGKILDIICESSPEVAVKVASFQVFGPLMTMLSSGEPMSIRAEMSRAIVELKLTENSYARLIEAGVIQPLLDLLQNACENDERIAAAKAMECLSGIESNKVAICKAGAIPALVKFLSSDDQEMRLAIMGTLANLATDNQGAAEIDQAGAVSRLLGMLRSTPDAMVHEYALKTLECMAKDSKTVRYSIKELNEGSYFIDMLQNEDISASCRSSILGLLCHLTADRDTRKCVVLSNDVLHLLIELLSQPIELEEKESILGILSGSANVPDARHLLLGDDILGILVKFLGEGSNRMEEYAVVALAKIMESDQATVDRQLYIARNGAIPLLIKLVKYGSVLGKCCAAATLGFLSKSTPRLTVKLSMGKRIASMVGFKRYQYCKVHAGKCNTKRTLCLVESGAAVSLIHLLEEREALTAEKAVEALSTLIENDENTAKGLAFLVKHRVIPSLLAAVGKIPSLTDKVVKMLEQIFRDRRFRDEKYWSGAQATLVLVIATAQGAARRAAAQALEHLGLAPKGSTTYTD